MKTKAHFCKRMKKKKKYVGKFQASKQPIFIFIEWSRETIIILLQSVLCAVRLLLN